ncbi:MAG: hypothetical protein ACYS8Y_05875, partial [Planctomycetota bacterium]
MACGVAGYNNGTSSLVTVAHEADVIDYVVDVSNGPFDIHNGVVTLTLPDGTVRTLDSSLSLPAGGTAQYPVTFPPVPVTQEYTVNSGDIGNNGAPAGHVQALSSCVADAIIPGSPDVQVTGTGQWPIRVINPTTITTITSSAASVVTGGTVDLTITEENDGDVDLTSPQVVVTKNAVLLAT